MEIVGGRYEKMEGRCWTGQGPRWAGSEKMERVGVRYEKMEGRCSTGQGPRWAVMPLEEYIYIYIYIYIYHIQ